MLDNLSFLAGVLKRPTWMRALKPISKVQRRPRQDWIQIKASPDQPHTQDQMTLGQPLSLIKQSIQRYLQSLKVELLQTTFIKQHCSLAAERIW